MVKVIAAGALLMLTAGCAGPGAEATPSSTPKPAPKTAASQAEAVDANARLACAQLAKARVLRAKGKHEKATDGFGESASSMDAMAADFKAQSLALKSTVPAVRQIAMGDNAVPKLKAWCTSHGFRL